MEAPNPTDSSQTICFPTSKRKPAFSTRSGFCIDFGTRLAPFWHLFEVEMDKKTRKSRPSPLLKTTVFLNGFLIDFLTILALFWEAKGHKWRPKRPKGSSKGAPRRPKGHPKAPKWTPRALHMPRFWHPWGQRRPGGPHGAKKAPKSSPK